jgi:hypothetical protein
LFEFRSLVSISDLTEAAASARRLGEEPMRERRGSLEKRKEGLMCQAFFNKKLRIKLFSLNSNSFD